MTGAIPNIPLRNWRTQRHLSRAEMADRINASRAGVAERLACDEERIRRWESGEVRWPSPPYRRALKELTALEPAQLGLTTGSRTAQPPARIGAADAFRSEAELVDTLDLARMVTSLLPGVEDADDSGAGDADGRKAQRPAGGCGGALWSVRCRWWSARCRCQSTTSLTAERAAVSSTRFLLAAKAATRDCRARLLTARG